MTSESAVAVAVAVESESESELESKLAIQLERLCWKPERLASGSGVADFTIANNLTREYLVETIWRNGGGYAGEILDLHKRELISVLAKLASDREAFENQRLRQTLFEVAPDCAIGLDRIRPLVCKFRRWNVQRREKHGWKLAKRSYHMDITGNVNRKRRWELLDELFYWECVCRRCDVAFPPFVVDDDDTNDDTKDSGGDDVMFDDMMFDDMF